MKIITFIPVRSGSKSIPLKNIKELNGKPLTQWVIDVSNSSNYIDKTYISTDSNIISDKLTNTMVFKRSTETATDTASSESALIEFCKSDEIDKDDIIIFIQATSPLLSVDELNKGIELMLNKEYDSVLSVVRQRRFIWNEDGTPNNYDIHNRPRRQDWNGYLVENGAFYISKVKDILKSKCRISGKIGFVECDGKTYYEIDELSDWKIIENLI